MENREHYYFYLSEGVQRGPVPAEQLRRYITDETLVWREGLEEWIPAGELAELRPLLESDAVKEPTSSAPSVTSAPLHQRMTQGTPPPKPNNYLIWSILLILFCSSVTGLVGLIFGITCNQRYAQGDYRGADFASSVARNCVLVSVIAAVVMVVVVVLLLTTFGGAVGALEHMMESGEAFME